MQNGEPKFVTISEDITVQETPNVVHSSRWLYSASALLVLALGWCARGHASALPTVIGTYAPDTLWALQGFLLVAAVKPHMTIWRTALMTLPVAYAIEFSQLYQVPWINSIRATRLGGLVLGHGFLWSDLVCYAAGIAIGVLLDGLLFQEHHGNPAIVVSKAKR